MESIHPTLFDAHGFGSGPDAVELRARGGESGTLHKLSRSLWRVMSGGHGALGYVVQGAPSITTVRADGRRVPVLIDTGDDGKSWRPARELVRGPDGTQQVVPRLFTPATMEAHLRGRYSVAPEAAGWVEWVGIDIDAHAGADESPADARARARCVLAQVLEALACGGDRWPLMQRSPGDGFHVWLPLAREGGGDDYRWPAAWGASWVRFHLAERGVELRDGVCEVYPAGRRLRAPCGRGSVLLRAVEGASAADVIDPFKLGEWPGTMGRRARWLTHGDVLPVRRVGPMVAAFLGEWERQRRTLADWLGRPEAAWDAVWGFLDPPGEKNEGAANSESCGLTQQIDDDPGPLGRRERSRPVLQVVRGGAADRGSDPISPSSVSNSLLVDAAPTTEGEGASRPSRLVKGPAFWRKVSRLLSDGVTETGTRHDAVMVLTFAWAAAGGLDEEATIARLIDWCGAHAHTGSRLAGSPAFTRECVREARGYLKRHMPLWPFRGGRGARGDASLGVLTAADRVVVERVDARVRTEAAIVLAFLAGRAGRDGRVGEPVEWCASLAARLVGDRRVVIDGARRRACVIAWEELARLGVVTLHKGHAVGRHGRLWSCWYRFGSGELPQAVTVLRATWEAAGRREPLVPSLAMAAAVERQEAPGGAFVELRQVGARNVREGVLLALSDAGGAVRVVLEPGPWASSPAAPGYRPAWWLRQFRGLGPPAVGVFLRAHEGRLVLGARWVADRVARRARGRAGARQEIAAQQAPDLVGAGNPAEKSAAICSAVEFAACVGEGGAVDRTIQPVGELPSPIAVVPELAGAIGAAWAAWERLQGGKERKPEES